MFVYQNDTGMIIILPVLLGLVVGSFVSAVTYRVPRGLGFIKGRSFCDNCKKELRWYDNIPLFSFLRYGGKSRCCDKPISIRYPLTEIITALGALLIYNFSPIPLVNFVLFVLCLTVFIIDLEHQIIPDEVSWIIFGFALITLVGSPFNYIFSGFLFAVLILFIHLITKGKGMGLGDVKLALALGTWLGLEKGFTWLFLSFLTGGIVASILLITSKAKLKTKIAFGPFMIIAFLITYFFLK